MGLVIVHGGDGTVNEVINVIDKVKTQKGVKIEHATIKGANHFFENNVDQLLGVCADYLDRRLAMVNAA